MNRETQSLDRFGVVTVLSLSVIWGVNPIILKTALVEFSPLALSGIRCAIGCLLLLLYAAAMRRSIFCIDGTEAINVLAALLFMGQFMAVFESLRWTTLSHSIVFLYCAPLFVALGATFLLKDERLRPLQGVGVSLAFLRMASEFVGSWGVSHPFGDAMALLAALLRASTTLLIKGSMLARIDPAKVLLPDRADVDRLCRRCLGARRAGTDDLSASTYLALLW
jgi:drug/metabolite transporter (DMT)-like permease